MGGGIFPVIEADSPALGSRLGAGIHKGKIDSPPVRVLGGRTARSNRTYSEKRESQTTSAGVIFRIGKGSIYEAGEIHVKN